MAIQRLAHTHPGSPQGIEQIAGRAQDQFRHHHLGLGRVDFSIDIGLTFGLVIPGLTCNIGPLQWLGCAQGGRFCGIHLGRYLPDYLQDLRITTGGAGIAVAVDPLALTHLLRNIALHRTADPCQYRQ